MEIATTGAAIHNMHQTWVLLLVYLSADSGLSGSLRYTIYIDMKNHQFDSTWFVIISLEKSPPHRSAS